jgi:hypothetical protein
MRTEWTEQQWVFLRGVDAKEELMALKAAE